MHKLEEMYQNLPATRALEMMKDRLPEREYRCVSFDRSTVSSSSSLSAINEEIVTKKSFDMADLLHATKPVEMSISFPAIEWDRHDVDEDETDSVGRQNKRLSRCEVEEKEEEFDHISHGKRRKKRGMFRSVTVKSSLSSLGNSTSFDPAKSTFALDRNFGSGSWGHFVSEKDDLPDFSIGSTDSDHSFRRKKPKQGNSVSHLQQLAQQPLPIQFMNSTRRIVL